MDLITYCWETRSFKGEKHEEHEHGVTNSESFGAQHLQSISICQLTFLPLFFLIKFLLFNVCIVSITLASKFFNEGCSIKLHSQFCSFRRRVVVSVYCSLFSKPSSCHASKCWLGKCQMSLTLVNYFFPHHFL